MQLTVDMTPQEVDVLLQHLRGLTFFEVRKIVTQAVVEDGRLDSKDIEKVLEAKKRVIERSGVLEYHPAELSLEDVAGLEGLKAWLRKRQRSFVEPAAARRFGLTPPRGILVLGVQGCGKSLCAKAVAREWGLPLIRLDPSNLYSKYHGESEQNLRRATRTAEQMAPIVLWIDEIEKAFAATSEGGDSGVSQRIFGSFLTWMNEKKDSVFVMATANDVSMLPPELLRKGRFDEVFFVDLPKEPVRRTIFALHLRRRGRSPDAIDLDELAARTEGFSGAEIEQVVVSALYTAFSEHTELDTKLLLREIETTRPLSITMAERIESLRAWARDRTVSAD
jgi:SpoVK/Ycf46/Vps4 family AAA+-type ATPase